MINRYVKRLVSHEFRGTFRGNHGLSHDLWIFMVLSCKCSLQLNSENILEGNFMFLVSCSHLPRCHWGGCFRGSAIQLSPPWGMIPWYHDFAGAHWTMNCFVQVSICDLNLLETPYQSISAIISDGKDLHLPPRLQKCVPCQQPLGQDLSFDIRQHPAGSGSLMKWRVWPCPDLLLCFFFKDTRRDSHVFQSFWWNEPIIPGGYPPPNLSLFSLPPRFWNEHGNTIVFTF